MKKWNAMINNGQSMQCTRIAVVVSLILGIASQAAAKPLKVFILAGQSNMEGQGVADLEGKDYNQGRRGSC